MKKNLLITSVGLLLLAGLAWVFLGGLFGNDKSVGQWNESDETRVAAEDTTPPDSLQADEHEITNRTAVAAGAPEVVPQEQDDTRVAVTLRGRVIDSFKTPIASAMVLLEIRRDGGGQQRMRGRQNGGQNSQRIRKPVETGKDGTFTFQGPGYAQLAVTLVVTHPQYAPTVFQHSFPDVKGELDVGDVQVLRGGSIAGSVTDIDGHGLPGATVQLQMQGNNRRGWLPQRDELLHDQKADQNGFFLLQHIMPGQYRVDATAPAHLRETSELVTVSDGAQEQLEPIRLGPGATLTGAVFAPNGATVADADVEATTRRGNHQDKTDKNGQFSIDHLPSDPLTVHVTAKGFVTFAQANVDPKAAPLVVRLAEGLRLSGVVRDAVTGELVTRYGAKVHRVGDLPHPELDAQVAQLQEQAQRMRDQMRASRGQDGNAAAPQGDPEKMRQDFEALRAKMAEAGVQIDRGGRGPGGGNNNQRGRRGQGPNGQGSQGADRGAGGDRGPGRQGNRQGNGNRPNFGPFGGNAAFQSLPGDTGDVLDRPNGTFTFTGLDEGVYAVDIGSPQHQKVRTPTVELRVGTPAADLVVNLPRGFTITGKVISSPDNAPVAGAHVDLMLIPEDNQATTSNPDDPRNAIRGFWMQARRSGGPNGFPVLTERTNAKGEFTVRNAPPGRYALAADASGHSRRTSDVFDLRTDTANVQLVLGALASIEGKVSGVPRGREQDAHVMAFASFGNMETRSVNPDGTYRIDDLQPGSYMVRAFLGEMRSFIGQEMGRVMRSGEQPRMDVTLEDGDHKTLDLAVVVEAMGEVSGTVMRNGEPAKGLRVSLVSNDQTDANGLPGGAGGARTRGGMPGGGQQFGRGGRRGMPGMGGAFSSLTDQHGVFSFKDVPEGPYSLRVQSEGRGRSELWRQEITVRADASVQIPVMISTGALEGRVTAETANVTVDGNIQLLPGVAQVPDDIAKFTQDHAVQQIPVRNSTFSSTDLVSGDYLLVLNLRGRERTQQQVTVAGGSKTTIELKAGATKAKQPATK